MKILKTINIVSLNAFLVGSTLIWGASFDVHATREENREKTKDLIRVAKHRTADNLRAVGIYAKVDVRALDEKTLEVRVEKNKGALQSGEPESSNDVQPYPLPEAIKGINAVLESMGSVASSSICDGKLSGFCGVKWTHGGTTKKTINSSAPVSITPPSPSSKVAAWAIIVKVTCTKSSASFLGDEIYEK